MLLNTESKHREYRLIRTYNIALHDLQSKTLTVDQKHTIGKIIRAVQTRLTAPTLISRGYLLACISQQKQILVN